MKSSLLAMLVVMVIAVPVALAQSSDDVVFQQAQAAYNRGDYAAAKAGWESLAAKGQGRAMEKLAWSYLYAPAPWGNDKAKSRSWYERCVKTDESQCLLGWGWELASGQNYPKELDAGLALYRRAAEKGHAQAMTNLGWHYATGTGVAKDAKRALEWYGKGAAAGNSLAMSNLAAMYLEGAAGAKDYQKGREWAQRAADAGDRYGMNWMGVIHHNGWGVPVDLAKARAWYEKSAVLGNDVAKNNLALLPAPVFAQATAAPVSAPASTPPKVTLPDYTVELDPDKSSEKYKQCQHSLNAYEELAQKGDRGAMEAVGDRYWTGGACVARDRERARRYYKAAADGGRYFAIEKLKLADAYLAATPVAKAPGQAEYEESERLLQAIYDKAFSITKGKDPEKSKKIVRQEIGPVVAAINRSAELGYTVGRLSQASLYYYGDWVEKDLARSLGLYLLLAEEGNPQAMLKVGRMNLEALGTETNLDEARYWFERAANQGNAEAMGFLGSIYDPAYKRVPDMHLAVFWHQMAWKNGNPISRGWLETHDAMPRAQNEQVFVDRIDREGPNRSDPGAFAYDVGVYCQYRGKRCNQLRGEAYRFQEAWNARAESANMRRIQSVYRREAEDPDKRTKCLQQKSESIRRATYGQQDWYYDGKC